jgi:signal transduction histidine kinase
VPDSPATLLWAFIAGVLTVTLVLTALGAALVIYQRRFVAMHRAHSQNLIKAQEEERAFVAREVHDDAVQRLALIGREVDEVRTLEPPLSGAQAHRLDSIQEEMKDLSVALRGLAHRLHPALLDKGGLYVALKGLCGDIERAFNLRVTAEIPDAPISADPDRALAVYRIAQEALRNAATHSGAGEATLVVSRIEGVLRLVVADRGRGFDSRQRRGPEGLGLIGMQERAAIAGGTVTVSSRPGEGTTVELSFPAPVNAAL